MVKSQNLYTPQGYCEKMTGCCYGFSQDDTVSEIEAVLERHGLKSKQWSYPLDEIEKIVKNDINVVLVDVSGFDKQNVWRTKYRWFEVPDGFEEGVD